MATSRRRRSRIAIAAAAVAAVVLTTGLTTGCDAVNKALDCVQTAEAIADSVTELQQAVEDASNDPTKLQESIDTIGENLDKIGSKTDDADLDKATEDMRAALIQLQGDIQNGDKSPDISGVTDAAGELTKVCTS
ncbi:hypothetical protein EJ357_17385 [Streptomyces cyaneochromogenes]|uniref:Secreted protein n=1 Tax=Streptomyces cyaneochromogenes TaxID=2496836 RepID=A0A3Q9EMV8_9ACTN|nr:hypothetical protein [Streptomyces cyaneochromogenes]AZQ35044.1 hypothetical protein EJ357_17385 [Streptomyces cyaneochromogenes]